jgi:hypothetical protein
MQTKQYRKAEILITIRVQDTTFSPSPDSGLGRHCCPLLHLAAAEYRESSQRRELCLLCFGHCVAVGQHSGGRRGQGGR